MVSKLLIVLLVSILPLMSTSTNQVSPSQVSTSLTTIVSSSTFTSYNTYSIGTTQITSTVTSTIYNGNFPLMGWGAVGCLSAGFPFTANPGDQLAVNFASDVPVDFYLMSAGQFQHLPPVASFCSAYGYIPVLPSLKSASYQTSYSLVWTPPLPGQYFIALLNLQPATATVMLSATLISVVVGSAVVNATATTTITYESSQVSSALVTAENSTVSSQQTPLLSQNVQWVAVVVILVVLGAVYFMSKKRSVKTGNVTSV